MPARTSGRTEDARAAPRGADAIGVEIEDLTVRFGGVTPLVEPGSIQVDYIKSAGALGIPSALCVASWDNLTNKGSVRVAPDRVFVWNEAQKREAVDMHGIAASDVVVTGAMDKTVRMWDFGTGEVVGEPFAGHAGQLAVGQKEQWVARDCLVEQLHRAEQIFFCPRAECNPVDQVFRSQVGIVGNQVRGRRLLDGCFLCG